MGRSKLLRVLREQVGPARLLLLTRCPKRRRRLVPFLRESQLKAFTLPFEVFG
jgi:hypothetical protein